MTADGGGKKSFRILVVDDDALSRQMILDMLVPLGYTVETASTGTEGADKAASSNPDLLLLDVVMPGMDGFQVCEKLKGSSATRHIPIVLVTSLEDRDSRLQGLASGANDFLSKPIDSAELTLRVRNLLRIKEFEDILKGHTAELEAQVQERTAMLQQALQDLQASKEELKESYLDTIFKLTTVAEYKDGFTASHIKKVGHYCRILARDLGWPDEEQDLIYHASPMHDIGKVSLPSDILLKPGRLTKEEFDLAKTHTTLGAQILKGSSSRYLRMAEEIALTHHERWDGSGYPQGLKGAEIPPAGMIMNVADQYDALRSERPYKPPFSHEKVCAILIEGDGRTLPGHFSSEILQAFQASSEEFAEIFEEYEH